jgi:hypothetical protein
MAAGALVGQGLGQAARCSLDYQEVHLKAAAFPRASRKPDPWANGLEARSGIADGSAFTTRAGRTRL